MDAVWEMVYKKVKLGVDRHSITHSIPLHTLHPSLAHTLSLPHTHTLAHTHTLSVVYSISHSRRVHVQL